MDIIQQEGSIHIRQAITSVMNVRVASTRPCWDTQQGDFPDL